MCIYDNKLFSVVYTFVQLCKLNYNACLSIMKLCLLSDRQEKYRYQER